MKMALRMIGCFLLFAIGVSAHGGLQKSDGDKQKRRSSEIVGEVKSETANGSLYAASYALLIGASDYDNKDAWDNLPGVLTDLDEVGKALEKHGFIVEYLRNPTRQEFRNALDSFIDRYGFKYDNRLLVYFAGHGFMRKREDQREVGYLVMRDAPAPPRFREDSSEFMKKVMCFDEIDG